MILGMSIQTFTTLHVIISLIGIASGLVVLFGLLTGKGLPGWTGLFLFTTILTSATGFLFPLKQIGPPHIVGAISLVVLAVAVFALYAKHLVGGWRAAYIVTALFSLYLNAFVGVVQLFGKIAFFTALAPTQKEPPFLVAQALTLGFFALLGVLALKRFHPAATLRTAVLS
jgi:hypothetical protein